MSSPDSMYDWEMSAYSGYMFNIELKVEPPAMFQKGKVLPPIVIFVGVRPSTTYKYFFVHLSFTAVLLTMDGQVMNLQGTLGQGPKYPDYPNSDEAYYVFDDLVIGEIGDYELEFTLWDDDSGSMVHWLLKYPLRRKM